MHDQRRSDRKSLDSVVPVTNAITGEQLGHIGNISAEGMMLIARSDLEEGHMFQICFALPEPSGDERAFNVGAICLWCSEASSPNTYWAGFEIMDISDDEALTLRSIITEL